MCFPSPLFDLGNTGGLVPPITALPALDIAVDLEVIDDTMLFTLVDEDNGFADRKSVV